ncbi:unnamed protein product, partial [Schistosoma curassoni]|uniref:Uncharacterized protein n=1 Tax=Schistosoma curassoni TaxID=6186 RepID=A0A183KRH6_9TREM
AQPYFIPFQYHTNGTANFLANFNNPFDAQTAVHYCPNGSLRSNKYIIGAACLIPSTNTNNVNCITSSSSSLSSSPIVPIHTTNILNSNHLINTSNFLNYDFINSGIFLLPSTTSTIQHNRLQ